MELLLVSFDIIIFILLLIVIYYMVKIKDKTIKLYNRQFSKYNENNRVAVIHVRRCSDCPYYVETKDCMKCEKNVFHFVEDWAEDFDTNFHQYKMVLHTSIHKKCPLDGKFETKN